MKELNNQKEFEDLMAEAGNKLVVVDFWADWCGPCKIFKKLFQDANDDPKYKDKVIFAKVDVDEACELSEKMNIECMPTVLFFRRNEKVDTMSGANLQVLQEKIDTQLSKD